MFIKHRYIEIINQPKYDRAKCYYYNGQLRIEMAAVGPDCAGARGIIVILINLFGIAKGIEMRLLVNCSYAKTGVRGAQPDACYYIGDKVQMAPRGSSIVNLDSAVAPDLAIEIADSSLVDDVGTKRMAGILDLDRIRGGSYSDLAPFSINLY